MSYDLMVFETSAAPAERGPFLDWCARQTEWTEGHGYDDPAVSSPALAAWFHDMRRAFPPMNGPYQGGTDDDARVTDYSVGAAVIYAAFAWSQAEAAYRVALELARRHRLGFYDVSADDGQVWLPTASGGYAVAHGSGASGPT